MTTCCDCRYTLNMCQCERFKAYAGAKFADEPVEADLLQTFSTLADAKIGIAQAKRGGHGFIHDTCTGEWFGNDAGREWRVIAGAAA